MEKSSFHLSIFLCLAILLLQACSKEQAPPNQLSDQEKKEGWVLLFDGKTTDGWHLYNKGKVPSSWMVKDGELYCDASASGVDHGDLISDQNFQNYELTFEWKISLEGNSGVFINVQETDTIPTAWASGPEYQLLDQYHRDYALSPAKRPGCLFNYAPQMNAVEPKAAGEWNQSKIIQSNGKIEFYLNKKLTARQDFNSSEWKDYVANSNFKIYPEFGKHTQGHIGLQEWSKGIAFRNIKIKAL